MGIDALDIMIRLEQVFGVKIPGDRAYWSEEERQRKRSGTTTATVGEIHQRVCDFLREVGLPIPDNSWERVTRCIGDALMITPTDINPEDRLVQDLGAT